ncbi:protein phosphatase 2C domain-containing protein [Actinopolymorpha alba]|uniref:protein phosphatase 2C domain-containing protein n=1 Tax=Actinopolymorpha alba TaxID=533267 RepID=UPI0003763B96|nr:protein phosphatase 2C domain-containing protein [Actinopolymorpha alba]
MYVTYATEPGDPAIDNEDFVAASPELAVVLDGVTPMDRTDTGCRHGVAWYARTLGTQVARLAAAGTGTSGADARPLADCLAEGIVQTRDAHADTCDPAHPDSPAATVAAVRIRDQQLEYLVLADSAVVIDLGSDVRTVTDRRASQVGRRLRSVLGARPSAVEVRSHRNREAGYYVAAERPEVAYEAFTGVVEVAPIRRVMVASDGATRLIDTFRVFDWRSALDALQGGGPEAWIARTREVEREHAEQSEGSTGAKVHDDATVVFLAASSV